jgi:hypothetical protein
MKKFSVVLIGIIALIFFIPATQAAIFNGTAISAEDASDVVEVSVDIRPNSLSFNSKGDWVTCYITTPERYSVHDFDTASIFLETLAALPEKVGIVDRDSDGIYELMVKFMRAEVLAMIDGSLDSVDLRITGNFLDGTTFFGVDTVNLVCF